MTINDLIALGAFVYGYCTDFVINLANLLGLSYYEINAFFFVLLWPAVTVGLLLVNAYQSICLKLRGRNAVSKT